jgi:hypothetical protein
MTLFTPGSGIRVTTSTTSAATAIPKPQTGERSLMLSNNDTAITVYIKFGDSTVEATVNDLAMLPFESRMIKPPATATHFALIAASGTPVVSVTSGWGDSE